MNTAPKVAAPGPITDRMGWTAMAITAGICLLGALLTAATPDFYLMTTGRLLYGIGAETFNITNLAAVALWFPSRYTALGVMWVLWRLVPGRIGR